MSSTSRGMVTAEQDLRLIGPDHLVVPLTAGLRYSREDPYAIRMSFRTGLGEPVEWTFGRDLLAAALLGPEGMGDVRAWPSAPAARAAGKGSASRGTVVNIVLGSPDGYAHFETGAAGIEAFLTRTYELVPRGHESGCLNIDAELAELLSEA